MKRILELACAILSVATLGFSQAPATAPPLADPVTAIQQLPGTKVVTREAPAAQARIVGSSTAPVGPHSLTAKTPLGETIQLMRLPKHQSTNDQQVIETSWKSGGKEMKLSTPRRRDPVTGDDEPAGSWAQRHMDALKAMQAPGAFPPDMQFELNASILVGGDGIGSLPNHKQTSGGSPGSLFFEAAWDSGPNSNYHRASQRVGEPDPDFVLRAKEGQQALEGVLQPG